MTCPHTAGNEPVWRVDAIANSASGTACAWPSEMHVIDTVQPTPMSAIGQPDLLTVPTPSQFLDVRHVI